MTQERANSGSIPIPAERNEAAIDSIQKRKLEARDRLRNLRAEMRQLDVEMIRSGANGADLVLMCW